MILPRRSFLIGAASTLALPVAPARARKPLRGGYPASAVHFDGSTWLVNSSLSSVNSPTFSFSFWFKIPATPSFSPVYWIVDPENTYTNYVAGAGPDQTLANVVMTVGDIDRLTGFAISTGVWHHLLCSCNVVTHKMYALLDGVQVGLPVVSAAVGSTLLFNSLPLWIGADSFGDNFIGDIADIWIAPGVSLLNSSGVIPAATVPNFRTGAGKPVNPATYASLYGAAVLLSGRASAFATNRGTGGAFATTGMLTNATTSPSD